MTMPGHHRYTLFRPLTLTDRTWPDAVIDRAPRWLSTDLRDGNQALDRPLDPARKHAMFELLVSMGFTEIEVGFPAASQDDYDFVRLLIEEDRIPDDVSVSVLIPARSDLVERSLRSLEGVRRATLHLYNATAPRFRRLVYGIGRPECKSMAVRAAEQALDLADRWLRDCDLGFQYSPEVFNETEPEFALDVCEAVMDVWRPGPGREIILNFPATVERSQPHVFADQIEWMSRHLSRREHVCLSVHPHNDRGTAVAATELAILAGAQRVEGCLFGNGERAGNVCLVTLGLNLFCQGIDPGLDFSDLGRIRRVFERCTGQVVPPRHPYAGDLVYTAFSGAHQDGISKGLAELERAAELTGTAPGEQPWRVPYLPLDPKDVGRSYEAIVRVNSQSGKGGVAYVMRSCHGLNLPRELHAEFAALVKARSTRLGEEMTPVGLWRLFCAEYLCAAPGEWPSPGTDMTLHVGATPALTAAELDDLVTHGFDVRVLPGGDRATNRVTRVEAYARWDAGDVAVWGVGLADDPLTACAAATEAAAARRALFTARVDRRPTGAQVT